jgi:hypothetical protein
MDILDLAGNCGDQVIPGNTARVWAVCACDITTFPGFLATTGVGDSITLDGNIVLAASKKFAKIDVVVDSGEVKHNQVGSVGSKNYTNSFGFKVVKNIASDEWFNKHVNACFVFLVEDKEGNIRVLGNVKIPAMMDSSEGTTGTDNGTEKIWTAMIMDKTGKVAPYYTGTIDETA